MMGDVLTHDYRNNVSSWQNSKGLTSYELLEWISLRQSFISQTFIEHYKRHAPIGLLFGNPTWKEHMVPLPVELTV